MRNTKRQSPLKEAKISMDAPPPGVKLIVIVMDKNDPRLPINVNYTSEEDQVETLLDCQVMLATAAKHIADMERKKRKKEGPMVEVVPADSLNLLRN